MSNQQHLINKIYGGDPVCAPSRSKLMKVTGITEADLEIAQWVLDLGGKVSLPDIYLFCEKTDIDKWRSRLQKQLHDFVFVQGKTCSSAHLKLPNWLRDDPETEPTIPPTEPTSEIDEWPHWLREFKPNQTETETADSAEEWLQKEHGDIYEPA